MKNLLVLLTVLFSCSMIHAMTAGELKDKCKSDESFCTGYISGALDSMAQDTKDFYKKFNIPSGTPFSEVVLAVKLEFLQGQDFELNLDSIKAIKKFMCGKYGCKSS